MQNTSRLNGGFSVCINCGRVFAGTSDETRDCPKCLPGPGTVVTHEGVDLSVARLDRWLQVRILGERFNEVVERMMARAILRMSGFDNETEFNRWAAAWLTGKNRHAEAAEIVRVNRRFRALNDTLALAFHAERAVIHAIDVESRAWHAMELRRLSSHSCGFHALDVGAWEDFAVAEDVLACILGREFGPILVPDSRPWLSKEKKAVLGE